MSAQARNIALSIMIAVLTLAGTWLAAQGRPLPGAAPGIMERGLELVAPEVIAGSDLGFRVERMDGNIAVGRIVVRINGRWTDAQVGSGGIVNLTQR